MKQYWLRFAARVDDMTLRQRGMLFATVSLVVVVFVHVALIEPLLQRQRALIDRGTRDQSQLTAVRAQLEGVLREQEQGGSKDPDQIALLALEMRLAEVEKALAARKGAFVGPTQLPELLKGLVGPTRPVHLESLRTLPGARVAGAAELYRHGVEITLRGSYFDLTQYLSDVERLPARVLWGPVELQVEQYPEVRLTLQIQTVSTQRALSF
jgi:MSHA biogenesis protein MshJ